MKEINFESYCEKIKNNEKRALESLNIQNWFINRIKKSNYEGYFYDLDTFVKNYHLNNKKEKYDFLDYYLEDTYNSIIYLMDNLNEKLIKEYLVLPLNKVREFNSKSILWLNSKPGSTVKQKLKQSKKLLSSRSRMTLDNLENSLFVEYLKKILHLFSLRNEAYYNSNYLNYKKNEYLEKRIQSFLQREEIKEIKKWSNLPPNNTLISHKYYGKIWKSWNIIKKIDEIFSNHYENFEERNNLKLDLDKKINNNVIYCQDFVEIDIENFIIKFDNLKIHNKKFKKENKEKKEKNLKYLSTNFFTVTPSYAYTLSDDKIKNINEEKYILNQKKYENHISCLESKYIDLSKNGIETYSLLSALNEEKSYEKTEKINRLIELYKNVLGVEEVNYIIPDYFDPFSLKELNKIIKSKFKEVNMIPKSIATVYFLQENNCFDKIQIGDKLIILDIVGNVITATIITGKNNKQIDDNIEIRDKFINTLWEIEFTKSFEIPEDILNEIYKLISPSLNLSKKIVNLFGLNELSSLKNITVRYNGKDYELNNINLNDVYEKLEKPLYKFLNELEKEINSDNTNLITVGEIFNYTNLDILLNITESNVNLGCQNYVKTKKEIEKYIKDIVLWRIYLPKLSIKLIEEIPILDGMKHKINPILGEKISVDGIKYEITLPGNKNIEKYEFELVRENHYGGSSFIATIKDYAFPLDKDLTCKIEINYTYGAEDPFEIFLVPKDKQDISKKLEVVLKEREGYEYHNLNIPEFPKIKSWNDLNIEEFEKNINDFMEEEIILCNNLTKLSYGYIFSENNIIKLGNKVKIEELEEVENIIIKENKDYFTKFLNFSEATYSKKSKSYFLNYDGINYSEKNFLKNNLFSLIDMSINYELKGTMAINIRPSGYNEKKIIRLIRKKDQIYKSHIYKFLKEIFYGGNSIIDFDCPEKIRLISSKFMDNILYKINETKNDFPKYSKSLQSIYSVMSQNFNSDYLYRLYIENGFTYYQMPFWFLIIYHNENFKKLYTDLKYSKKLFVLSRAIWWNKEFINEIKFEYVYNFIFYIIKIKGNDIIKENRKTMFLLELIYGMFLYRKSTDDNILRKLSLNNPDMKLLNVFIEKLKINDSYKGTFKFGDGLNIIDVIKRLIHGKSEDDISIKEIDFDS